jgi:hypothetical protein
MQRPPILVYVYVFIYEVYGNNVIGPTSMPCDHVLKGNKLNYSCKSIDYTSYRSLLLICSTVDFVRLLIELIDLVK